VKKYGQAELMYALIQAFLAKEENLTDEQKECIALKSLADILAQYPSGRDAEVM
jgi:hypothetical protein